MARSFFFKLMWDIVHVLNLPIKSRCLVRRSVFNVHDRFSQDSELGTHGCPYG